MNMNEPCGNPKNPQASPFYGKYKGKVVNNLDPLFQARLMVEVPAVPAANLNYAMPCVPYAGLEVGFYALPPIGANVWVEFEAGDVNRPIWTGCFWAEGELPPLAPTPETKFFKTKFVTMILNDLPDVGGFTLSCIPPAVAVPLTMLFNSEGITISCPEATIGMTPASITLSVPASEMAMSPETVSISVLPSIFSLNSAAIKATAADISVAGAAGVSVSAGADLSLDAAGVASLSAGAGLSLDAGGVANLNAGADLSIGAGGGVQVESAAGVAVVTETTTIGGLLNVIGDITMDGQQVMAI